MEVQKAEYMLGAFVRGLDISKPTNAEKQCMLEDLLGMHGVLCFPDQSLDATALKQFSGNFGTLEINVANGFQEPGMPEVMILSNIVENGRAIGLNDAGQSWHTDMSYSRQIAFANVLHAIEVPVRDGEPLGCTEFCDMQGAYDALPDDLKSRLDGMTILHDFNKFWDMMRKEKGSSRPPLTPAQRAAKPPVSHPAVLEHPLTGRKILYANPGYSMRINEMDEAESREVLDFLFKHQTEPRFRYRHKWKVGDVLMWDNIRTIHNAVADYRPDERRHIIRCQVIADRFPGLVA